MLHAFGQERLHDLYKVETETRRTIEARIKEDGIDYNKVSIKDRKKLLDEYGSIAELKIIENAVVQQADGYSAAFAEDVRDSISATNRLNSASEIGSDSSIKNEVDTDREPPSSVVTNAPAVGNQAAGIPPISPNAVLGPGLDIGSSDPSAPNAANSADPILPRAGLDNVQDGVAADLSVAVNRSAAWASSLFDQLDAAPRSEARRTAYPTKCRLARGILNRHGPQVLGELLRLTARRYTHQSNSRRSRLITERRENQLAVTAPGNYQVRVCERRRI